MVILNLACSNKLCVAYQKLLLLFSDQFISCMCKWRYIYSVPDDFELFRFCSTVELDELSQVVKSGTVEPGSKFKLLYRSNVHM